MMRVICIIAISLLIVPQATDCLSCYKCTSEVSWADCNSKMTKTSCSSGSPNCYEGVLICTAGNVTKTVFFKRCGEEGSTCDTTRQDTASCPSSIAGRRCCTGDNCNPGSTLKISFVVNVACLVLLLLCALMYIY
ncbi:PREDICTED: uncharacterized protein LOC107342767 [Acropora digitifera]|uniref:uncharacterized protein LOC107342767 n=1 Tax=Acropora digitifera TaxID=70779 RepID=UPI00077AFB48|nr:PREDICTED: uncharacterized protein LOC107342767 [Acropora digitifera]